jgi:hypothetical protein
MGLPLAPFSGSPADLFSCLEQPAQARPDTAINMRNRFMAAI